MVVTGFCFVAVTASVKMVGGDVPAAQAAFLRYALGRRVPAADDPGGTHGSPHATHPEAGGPAGRGPCGWA
jgi:hypothetical protein